MSTSTLRPRIRTAHAPQSPAMTIWGISVTPMTPKSPRLTPQMLRTKTSRIADGIHARSSDMADHAPHGDKSGSWIEHCGRNHRHERYRDDAWHQDSRQGTVAKRSRSCVRVYRCIRVFERIGSKHRAASGHDDPRRDARSI